MARGPPCGPGTPHYCGFTITLTQSVVLLWTSDQTEAKDPHRITHSTDKRQNCAVVGIRPTILAGERPQTHALDRAATGIDQK